MVANVLQRPTLVLNRNWLAVNVKPVSRALCMVWSGNAKIVDPTDYAQYTWQDWVRLSPEDETGINCVGFRIRVPEVITLARYSKVPIRSVSFSRRNLFARDKFKCQYCGRKPDRSDLTIDHIIPRSRGGVSSWENCVLACVSCNLRKANKTPREASMKLLTDPKKPRWSPRFHCKVRIPSWEKFVSEMYWNVELGR